jgi:hypothetical protein
LVFLDLGELISGSLVEVVEDRNHLDQLPMVEVVDLVDHTQVVVMVSEILVPVLDLLNHQQQMEDLVLVVVEEEWQLV